jgi:hypothetical protein
MFIIHWIYQVDSHDTFLLGLKQRKTTEYGLINPTGNITYSHGENRQQST